MSKKIKKYFDQHLTFGKMLNAHKRARKNKVYKNEVIKFEINLENNIINLINKIKKNTYHLGNYRSFIVKEPKTREIKALPYVDRVVHQWYIEEFIKPYILPRFVSTTYACIDGRGAHMAVNTIQHYMQIFKRKQKKFWILKCDVKKFFYNIDPNILYNILKKFIADKKLLEFTKLLIFDKKRKNENEVGIPIGNYTSQFFANIYLNELDKYAKNELKIKYYVRYMDDFIILLPNKNDCINIKKQIETFLWNNLRLELNAKSRYYPYKMGLNFCGYKIWTTHKLVRKDCKTKIKRKIKTWNKQWENKEIDFKYTLQSLNSWFGHISHANSYNLKQNVLSKCDFLYTKYTITRDIDYIINQTIKYGQNSKKSNNNDM